jgi:hypothetical protein
MNSSLIAFALLVSLIFIPMRGFAKDYTPEECPVVGNTNSKIYHLPGGRSYAKMLRENTHGDNRQCFKTEDEATKAGYRKSKS